MSWPSTSWSKPAEVLELLTDVAQIADLAGEAIELLLVCVNEADEVAQLFGACEERCFPNFALVALAVAKNGKNGVGLLLILEAPCNAGSGRNALTQRTGSHINAGGELFFCGI